MNDWSEEANCRDEDPELFFPLGESTPHQLQISEARRVCQTCPVSEACLAFALSTRAEYGMWGGKTPQERRRIVRTWKFARPRAEQVALAVR